MLRRRSRGVRSKRDSEGQVAPAPFHISARAKYPDAFSAKGDGAKVFKVDGDDDQRFTLVVVYPLPVTEMYQFTVDPSGRGTVIWAGVKNGLLGKITKGTLFTATCSK
jgi:hypothetical protein